jgi:hypothetical protein
MKAFGRMKREITKSGSIARYIAAHSIIGIIGHTSLNHEDHAVLRRLIVSMVDAKSKIRSEADE